MNSNDDTMHGIYDDNDCNEDAPEHKTWRERIDEASSRGYFTEEDVKLANSFNTCAVGERYEWHVPTMLYRDNPAMDRAGLAFFALVKLGAEQTFAGRSIPEYVRQEAISGADDMYRCIQALSRESIHLDANDILSSARTLIRDASDMIQSVIDVNATEA